MGGLLSFLWRIIRHKQPSIRKEDCNPSDCNKTYIPMKRAVLCRQCRIMYSEDVYKALSEQLNGFFENERDFLCHKCLGMTEFEPQNCTTNTT